MCAAQRLEIHSMLSKKRAQRKVSLRAYSHAEFKVVAPQRWRLLILCVSELLSCIIHLDGVIGTWKLICYCN